MRKLLVVLALCLLLPTFASAQSINYYPSGGGGVALLYSSTTATSCAGTGDATLMSYVVPGGTLVSAGDSLRITVTGTKASNANTITTGVLFGSTLVSSRAHATNPGYWIHEVIVSRVSATAQTAVGKVFLINSATNAGANMIGNGMYYTEPAETLSENVRVAVNVSCATAANDATIKSFLVERIRQ